MAHMGSISSVLAHAAEILSFHSKEFGVTGPVRSYAPRVSINKPET